MKGIKRRCCKCQKKFLKEDIINYLGFMGVICPKCAINYFGPDKYINMLDHAIQKSRNPAKIYKFKTFVN